VPVDSYRQTWDRLARGESWGSDVESAVVKATQLGVEFSKEAKDCKIAKVSPNTPAAKAGLQPGDVVVKFDNHKIGTAEELSGLLGKKKAGDEVALEVRRDKEVVTLKIVIGSQKG
jgi:serine protease Do